jgi:hypothetical protein
MAQREIEVVDDTERLTRPQELESGNVLPGERLRDAIFAACVANNNFEFLGCRQHGANRRHRAFGATMGGDND